MTRVQSISELIVPFRAPEIHQDIMEFSTEKYFYFDQEWNVDTRFKVLDDFASTFYQWTDLKLDSYNLYPVNGSTEAITECLLNLRNKNKKIGLLEKEYTYYYYVATEYNIPVKWIRTLEDLTEDCVFITSLPFCRDGTVKLLQRELLTKCDNKQIECWIDCAYFGAGKPVDFNIPKTTSNIFFSFSKNFGLALNRIGVWLSGPSVFNRSILNDYAYFPFGNLALVSTLMKKYPKNFLWENYRKLQLEVTNNPTDIIFLGNDGCLTGKMIEIIKNRYVS